MKNGVVKEVETMIEIVTQEEADAITHSGTMHADEVFATAFLDLYYGHLKVARVTELQSNRKKEALVYDIGRGKYDHHQDNAKVRDNGIKYCSFGLLWQDFGKDFLKAKKIKEVEEMFSAVDKDFIEMIDAIDNGIFPSIEASYKVKTTSDLIKMFNPSFHTKEEENQQFLQAVSFAQILFERELSYMLGKVKAKNLVLKELENQTGPILYLKEYMPYEETLLTSPLGKDILLVIFPSNRGGYSVQAVPISETNRENRLLLPMEWAGLEKEELQQKSGIKTLRFCHKNRFIACCDTKEDAFEIAKKTLLEKSHMK